MNQDMLPLFDMPDNDQPHDNRPLPERIASQHGFDLQSCVIDGVTHYSVADWMRGVMQKDDVRSDMRELRKKDELCKNMHSRAYKATNGRTYFMEYADDETLYRVAQQMKSTTGLREAILKLMAEALGLMDEAMRNPEKAARELQDYSDRRDYKRLIADGWSHDAAAQWLDTRDKQRTRRPQITNQWQARGAVGRDYATLTNAVTEVATGRTATQLKKELAVTNPRDHLSAAENAKIAGVELFSGILHTKNDSHGVDALKTDIEGSTQFLNFEAIERLLSSKRPGDVA